jgi:hypothetical protein
LAYLLALLLIYITDYILIIKCKYYLLFNFLINLFFKFINLFFRYKTDYLLEHPINKGSNNSNNSENKDEDDIYINNKEDYIKDELISYLNEKRADKKIS